MSLALTERSIVDSNGIITSTKFTQTVETGNKNELRAGSSSRSASPSSSRSSSPTPFGGEGIDKFYDGSWDKNRSSYIYTGGSTNGEGDSSFAQSSGASGNISQPTAGATGDSSSLGSGKSDGSDGGKLSKQLLSLSEDRNGFGGKLLKKLKSAFSGGGNKEYYPSLEEVEDILTNNGNFDEEVVFSSSGIYEEIFYEGSSSGDIIKVKGPHDPSRWVDKGEGNEGSSGPMRPLSSTPSSQRLSGTLTRLGEKIKGAFNTDGNKSESDSGMKKNEDFPIKTSGNTSQEGNGYDIIDSSEGDNGSNKNNSIVDGATGGPIYEEVNSSNIYENVGLPDILVAPGSRGTIYENVDGMGVVEYFLTQQ